MSDRVFAVLESGRVVNCVVGALVDGVDITDRDPRPAIGWVYADGEFAPPPAFSRDAALVRRDAINRVNQRAGESRARYLTDVPGQEITYMLKAAEDARYLVAAESGTPDALAYPMLNAEAVASQATMTDTVTLVATTAAQWKQLAAYIEGLRRGAIVAIERATTEDTVLACIPENWP